MRYIIKKIINILIDNPKMLFLIDSAGALITAFLLFVVLRNFNDYIGMPETILVYLSIIALLFSIYSLICFLFLKKNWPAFIRAISFANIIYCFSTLVVLLIHSSKIKIFGISYFLIEVTLVCILVHVELKVSETIRKRNHNI